VNNWELTFESRNHLVIDSNAGIGTGIFGVEYCDSDRNSTVIYKTPTKGLAGLVWRERFPVPNMVETSDRRSVSRDQ